MGKALGTRDWALGERHSAFGIRRTGFDGGKPAREGRRMRFDGGKASRDGRRMRLDGGETPREGRRTRFDGRGMALYGRGMTEIAQEMREEGHSAFGIRRSTPLGERGCPRQGQSRHGVPGYPRQRHHASERRATSAKAKGITPRRGVPPVPKPKAKASRLGEACHQRRATKGVPPKACHQRRATRGRDEDRGAPGGWDAATIGLPGGPGIAAVCRD